MEKDEMIAWAIEDAKDRGLGKIEVIIDDATAPDGCVKVDSYWLDGTGGTEHLVTLYRLMSEEEMDKYKSIKKSNRVKDC